MSALPLLSRRPTALAALIALAAVCVSVSHADVPLEFTGVMASGGSVKVALTDKTHGGSQWLAPGAIFHGYTVVSYDRAKEAVVVAKDGVETTLKLKDAKVTEGTAAAPLSPAAAKAIYMNLRQLLSASHRFYLEHGVTSARYEDLVGEGKYVRQLLAVAGEDYSKLKFSQSQPALSVATASGEAVTYDETPGSKVNSFYTVKPGDTGRRIAADAGITVAELQARNAGLNFARLAVGDVIRIR